jgi:hypothetical protein
MKSLPKTKILTKRRILKLLGVLYCFNIFYVLRLNPDPHHDGILFSAGFATNSGLVPQKDFYFLWGPLLPYFLTIPIKISSSLYLFRIFGYMILIITCYFMYVFAKHFLSKKTSLLLSLLWLFTFPAVSKPNFNIWPNTGTTWPNIYGFLLILLSCIMVLGERPGEKTFLLATRQFLSGFLILGTIFIRIDFIFIYIGFLVYVLRKNKSISARLNFLFPVLILIGIVMYLIASNNSLWSEWYRQTILNLFSNHYSSGVPSYTLQGVLRSFLIIILVSVAFIAISFQVQRDVMKRFLKSSVTFQKGQVFIFIAFLAFCVYVFNEKFEVEYWAWIKSMILNLSYGYLAICVLVVLFSLFMKHGSGDLAIVKIMAVCSIPLCHNFNLEYIWLNSIFILVMCTIFLANLKVKYLEHLLIHNLIICFTILMVGNLVLLNSKVYDYVHPILQNMQDRNVLKGQDLDRELKLIDSVPPNSRFQNQCVDYLYSISNLNVIQSSRALSFNLDPETLNQISKISNKWIFDCNLSPQELQELKDVHLITFVMKSTGNYSVLYKSDFK